MSARELFKTIISAGWPGVLVWKDNEEPESLHLEFKQKDRDGAAFNENDQDKLATAISAFANSDAGGGVFVFGVHAKGAKGYPDKVCNIVPIEQLSKFRNKIERCLQQITDPPVAGIQVEPICTPDDPEHGIIVVYVPQSDGGPHRVVKGSSTTNGRYFMRTAAATIEMHHGLLASMFGRRPSSSLFLMFSCSVSSLLHYVEVIIGNSGRGYAERPAIRFFQDPPGGLKIPDPDLYWHALRPNPGWQQTPMHADFTDGIGGTVRSNADTVLYPGMELPVCTIEKQHSTRRDKFRLSAHGILYALNMQPLPFSISEEIKPGEGFAQTRVIIRLSKDTEGRELTVVTRRS